MTQSSLDIILPCYNPLSGWDERVIQSVEQIRQKLPGVKLKVILVNDGSTTGVSQKQIDYLKQNLPGLQYVGYDQNSGKGYALRKGVEHSTADFCIYTDLDFPYQEHSLIGLYKMLTQSDADIVSGVRDNNYYANVPWFRKQISKILKQMNKAILKIPTTDTQCGLKGFNGKGREIFLSTKINRYLFDLEFIFLASKAKDITFKTYEVELKKDIVFSKISWKILVQEGFNFLSIFVHR